MQRSRQLLIGVSGLIVSLGCASEPNDLFADAAGGGGGKLPAQGGVGGGGATARGGSGAVVVGPEQPPITSGGSEAQGGSTAEGPAAGAGPTDQPPANGGAGAGSAGLGGDSAGAGAGGGSTGGGGSAAQAGGTSQGGRAGAGGGGTGAGRGGSGGGTPSGLGGSTSGGAASSATCRELRREMEDALREAQACRPSAQGRQCAEFVDDECGCAQPVDTARSLSVVAYEVARDAVTELCPLTCTPTECAEEPRSATCGEGRDGSNVCGADEGPQSGPGGPGDRG